MIKFQPELDLAPVTSYRSRATADGGANYGSLKIHSRLPDNRLDTKFVPRFGEFRSCCCLPVLPQLSCSILATLEWPYSEAL